MHLYTRPLVKDSNRVGWIYRVSWIDSGDKRGIGSTFSKRSSPSPLVLSIWNYLMSINLLSEHLENRPTFGAILLVVLAVLHFVFKVF